MDNQTFGEQCALKIMKKVGLDSDKVSKCLLESFTSDNEGRVTSNVLLAMDKYWADEFGIFLHPSVTVNNITFRGDLNGYDVFRAICAGF